MDIREIKGNKTQILLGIDGEMNIYHATEIKKELSEYLNRFEKLALDLSGVSEIDTSGYQILVSLKLKSKKENKKLAIINHSPDVLKIFDLYGAIGFFGDKIKVSSELKSSYSFQYGMKKVRE